MLELFLSLAFRCFCYYNHTQWPASENPAPLPDCSSQVPLFRTLATCKWQEGRNEHIPCLRLAILGDVCKINGFFTWLPHLPPFLIYKQPGIHTLRRWLFWRASLPCSWSAAFWILFFASTPHLSDSLTYCAASKVNLDSVTVGLKRTCECIE